LRTKKQKLEDEELEEESPTLLMEVRSKDKNEERQIK
jgi:hypothetical protein